jgi:hypothetical protein
MLIKVKPRGQQGKEHEAEGRNDYDVGCEYERERENGHERKEENEVRHEGGSE